MFSFLTQWQQLQGRFYGVRRRRPARRPGWRPRLDILEDRTVPSTLMVSKSGDDVSQVGTLRHAVASAQSGDTILIAPNLGATNTPITLTNGALVLDKDLTIEPLLDKFPATISGDGNSAVFEVTANAHVTLSQLTITGGAPWGIANAGSLTVSGSTLSHNATGIRNLGMLRVSDSTLSDNATDGVGGGIANFGSATVSGSTLSGNSANFYYGGYGGGIYNGYQASLTISNSFLFGNSASYGAGGGIANFFGTVMVAGCSFGVRPDGTMSGNSAGSGGGIANEYSGMLTVIDSTLSGNFAYGSGGGIANYYSATAAVNGSTVSHNQANDGGGGIANLDYGTVTVSGSTLTDNFAFYSGGGFFNDLASLTVSSCILSDNSAYYYGGGGIYNVYGTATVTGSTLTRNSAGQYYYGGGIYNFGGALYLGMSSVTGNTPTNIVGIYSDLGGNTVGLP
jgi:hypothetical protein